MVNSQGQQLLSQSEEMTNSRNKLSQQDEDFDERISKIEMDAERRIYEAEKLLKLKVITIIHKRWIKKEMNLPPKCKI